MADQQTDGLYAGIRQKFGQRGAGANGYQMSSFFRREQALLYSLLKADQYPLLDIACGSGLMLAPSLNPGSQVVGVDFNHLACVDAKQNGLAILRGDAFALPLATGSVAQVVNCQFLNQQTSADSRQFVAEVARVLKPGGRLVLFWRHADSLFHRCAGALVQASEWASGAARFPQHSHSFAELETMMTGCGLTVVEQLVSVPFFYPRRLKPSGIAASLVGASQVLVAEKQMVGGRG